MAGPTHLIREVNYLTSPGSMNAQAEPQTATIVGADELRRRLRRSLRWQKTRALLLIAPLLAFVLITFVIPIADMLFRSVENGIVSDTLPRTVAELRDWDPDEAENPGERVFTAMYVNLSLAIASKLHTRVGSRLNYELTGVASLFRKSGRSLRNLELGAYSDWFLSLDPSWGSVKHLADVFADPDARNLLPGTALAFDEWNRAETGEQPADFVYVSLLHELADADAGAIAALDGPLGAQIRNTAAGVGEFEAASLKEMFISMDKGWGRPELWRTLQIYSPRKTDGYFLNAVDLKKGFDGPEYRREEERIYLLIFLRTMTMSLTITITIGCVLLGYPVAYFLSHLPLSRANMLMILVLLPFWTSLLVRTSAWKVLLQKEGVINDILVSIGLISDCGRLAMINNQFGTIIAMTHILLPFMILPLYAVMKTIPMSYVRAARSLGASAWTAFRRIYFPLSLPGIGAGCVLVFILSIGYYITPELVGGTKGTFISNRIAYHISSSLNWGLGAALRGIAFEKLLVTFGDLIQELAASFDGGLSPWKCIPIYFRELRTPDAAMQPGTTCRRCS